MTDREPVIYEPSARTQQMKAWVLERLGLDPETTRNLSSEHTSGDPYVTVRWEGRASIRADEFYGAFNDFD